MKLSTLLFFSLIFSVNALAASKGPISADSSDKTYGVLSAVKVFPMIYDKTKKGTGAIQTVVTTSADQRTVNNQVLVIGLPGAGFQNAFVVDVEMYSIDNVELVGTDLVISGTREDVNAEIIIPFPVTVKVKVKETADGIDYLDQVIVR